jgi:hypothetical protein
MISQTIELRCVSYCLIALGLHSLIHMSSRRVACASTNSSQLCTSTCFNLRRWWNHSAEHVVGNRILLPGFGAAAFQVLCCILFLDFTSHTWFTIHITTSLFVFCFLLSFPILGFHLLHLTTWLMIRMLFTLLRHPMFYQQQAWCCSGRSATFMQFG